ncbi:very short patch repair endonuclease [Mesorhizobium sp. ANAO-SY3R2]|uniref:very short patch repair endonuclease n=1 Tax=Mesorhizobium sp. ANAO-SY3R2 TaxID=3166644 RepID=UPI003671A081
MDSLSPTERSARMSRVRAANTRPEMVVRRLIYTLGYRYRLHRRDLPGKPDLVFGSRRAVIFVHGCFWHRHPSPDCKLARMPKSRLDFWGSKLSRNRQHDIEVEELLKEAGWRVLTLWECELRDRPALVTKVREFLR